jgi:hypothetical protein
LLLLAAVVLAGLFAASASAAVYSSPGPMPPKEPACKVTEYGYEAQPCAETGVMCSHLVVPAFASEGQIVVARTEPAIPCNAWGYNEIPGEALSPCYLPAGEGGYVEPYGGVGLNECKFRVTTAFSTIWHINPTTNLWEITSGPGWTKVGIDLVCGYTSVCQPNETEDEAWMAVSPATLPPEEAKKEPFPHAAPGLSLSYSTNPERVLVHQNAKGAEPRTVEFTVTAKNTASTPIQNVTFADPLKITPIGHLPHATDVSGCTWAQGTPFGAPLTKEVMGKAPTSPPCPLSEPGEAKPGTLKSRNVGTIAPGASASTAYTLEVAGDGDYTIYTTVSGSREVENEQDETAQQTVNVVGSYHFQPETQLLMFSATLGAKVKGQMFPSLVKAGTHYLIDLHLENRSNYQQLQVDPIEPELSGNASDGEVVPANTSTAVKPSGSLTQVSDPPVLKLEPGEKRNYEVIVTTTGSDAFARQAGPARGTRSTVEFDPPDIATVNEEKPTPKEADQVVMEPNSTEFNVGVDDSAPEQPPFSLYEAAGAFGKGVAYGLWGATYGFVHGIFDLANLGAKGVYNVSTGTLDELDYLVELWTATANEPGAHQKLVEEALAKVEEGYLETPYLIDEKRQKLEQTVSNAIDAYFAKIYTAWTVGDWRDAIQDVTETGTNVLATAVGPAAVKVAAGTLARLPAAADALAARAASLSDQVGAGLQSVSAAIEPATTAIKALAEVLPGYRYTVGELTKFFGVSAKEADWMSAFTKAKKISLVFRSRAEESLAWLDKGAMLKPYWVKAKTVSWADVKFLGYSGEDVGRVVMRKPPATLEEFEASIVGKAEKGTPEYQTAIERWETRSKSYNKEIAEMEKWNEQGDIKGKWPWQENGVDPHVQSDEALDYKFRLEKDPNEAGTLIPEIFNPTTKKWGSITGDIDLIAITKADGTALTDLEHVQILKELRNSPLGSQHPESLTWTKDGEFWFKAKASYLKDEDLVQSGPDGVFRSVKFNENLSDPTSWTKLDYRIFWNGGYEVGPGQVTSPLAFAPATANVLGGGD